MRQALAYVRGVTFALVSLLLLLVGVLLGPGTGLLDRAALDAGAPVAALALGWTGAAFGVRFDRRWLARVSAAVLRWAVVSAAAAGITVAAGGWLLLRVLPPLRAALTPRLPVLLVLAAVAMVAAPGVLGRLVNGTGARWSFVSAAQLAAQIASAGGVLTFALTLGWLQPRGSSGGAPGLFLWILLTMGSGILIGLLFLSFTRGRDTPRDLIVALCGSLLLGAGAGLAGHLAPFLICAMGGLVIGHLSPHHAPVRDLLDRWDPVAWGVLLLVAGTQLLVPSIWLVPAALLLAGLRIAGLWLFGRVAGAGPAGAADFPDAGLMLAPQGAVALALGVSLTLGSAGRAAWIGPVAAAIAIGVVATQLAAPVLVGRALRPAPLTAAARAVEVTS